MNKFSMTYALLSRSEKRRALMVLAMVTGMAMLDVVGVASVMPFLAVLGNPQIVESNRILRTLYEASGALGVRTIDQFLMLLGLVAFIVVVVSSAYKILTNYVLNRFSEMRRHSIGVRLLESYLRQPYAFFLNRHSGDMSKAVLSEVDELVNSALVPVITMVANGLVVFFLVGFLLFVNPVITLIAAAVLGVSYGLSYLFMGAYLERIGRERARANEQRFTAAGEAFGGIKDVKLLGRERAYLLRFHRPSQRFSRSKASAKTANMIPNYVVESVVFGGILAITLGVLISSGGVASEALGQVLPLLGVYAFSAYRIKPAAQHIFKGFASMRYGSAAVESTFRDLYQNPTSAQLSRVEPDPLGVVREVSLVGVSFSFPNADSATLRDISLQIPVGSSLGIVGSTGAGKTTLVDVILGLLRPTEGALVVDGTPITEDNLRKWQRSLGYVPQDIFLTDNSVAENIALGIPPNKIDHEQIVRCAQMAQVHDFIMQELPQQYSTDVGERGVRLSGGQRQRIGIARALYHDPDVLVFDEATSALDTTTEEAVMDAIDALAHQKTIILITHRLSTLRNCDRIILLDKGRIRATGTFSELEQMDEQFRGFSSVQQ